MGKVTARWNQTNNVVVIGIETSRLVAEKMGWIEAGQSANPFGEAGDTLERQAGQP